MRKDQGFTLVEMLVVIAVLSIVAVMVLAIFTRTLRGSNKSQVVLALKQNGQAVLETMDKTIRNADGLVCLTDDSQTLVLRMTEKGDYVRYRFVIGTSKNNGSILQDHPQPPGDIDINQFLKNICDKEDEMIDADLLTDTNLLTGVSVSSGSFEIDELGAKDVVTIQFVLAPAVKTPEAIAGQIDDVTFQTSVELR